MLARDWIVILVLFGLVVGVGGLVVNDISSSEKGYDVPNMTDESYSNNYDTLTNATEKIYKMGNATASSEGQSTISVFTTFFTATFSVISIVFESFGLAGSTLTIFLTDIGMPSGLANLLVGGVVAIILAMLVFIIISAISRSRL